MKSPRRIRGGDRWKAGRGWAVPHKGGNAKRSVPVGFLDNRLRDLELLERHAVERNPAFLQLPLDAERPRLHARMGGFGAAVEVRRPGPGVADVPVGDAGAVAVQHGMAACIAPLNSVFILQIVAHDNKHPLQRGS